MSGNLGYAQGLDGLFQTDLFLIHLNVVLGLERRCDFRNAYGTKKTTIAGLGIDLHGETAHFAGQRFCILALLFLAMDLRVLLKLSRMHVVGVRLYGQALGNQKITGVSVVHVDYIAAFALALHIAGE
ncbi:hypothetical protein SDC9_176833 [bioreactor metagenome]|uniref:Uncharacterized protein n=1 Tax=bioreactor metagenome TaxID=1076179 RepID=A0A645GSW3_9ZZZZ